MKRRVICGLAVAGMVAGFTIFAQEADTLNIDHSECTFLGPQRERFLQSGLYADKGVRMVSRASFTDATEAVVSRLGRGENFVPGGSRTYSQQAVESTNVIDRNIFGVLQQMSVQPAPRSSDYEFIRRVTLDLTGRVPTAENLAAFVADPDPNKRTKLVDELLATPEWVDKWTMFFGDLYHNTDSVIVSNTNRYANGRQAFYNWIKDSLTANKPYNQMARELIAAQGRNSWVQGELNWQVGNRITGGPVQDVWDQMAASTAGVFLGMSHFNCTECHNGRGHLDSLSLWGKNATRMQAWGLSAFFAQTNLQLTRITGDANPTANKNMYYWDVLENTRGSYALNTTTGNRPARQPIGTTKVVTPTYFDGSTPNGGENWQAAAARLVTSDVQFGRASVNYVWRQLMVRGLVEPVDQFDLARLDPDNPPPDPWTLQPTNARLLKDLAQNFIDSGYNLKTLMKTIVTSDAYQLSSRYPGEWNPQWETLHARHLVRRLMAEEIYDAVVQTSGLPGPITYRVDNFDPTKTNIVQWAMQTPAPTARGGAAAFLNPFFPGDRQDVERRRDGSDQQAMDMMNNNTVVSRTKSVKTGNNVSLLMKYLGNSDRDLVDNLYLNVLSRYPSDSERATALDALKSGTRGQWAENLLWSLYNKVDFYFNY